MTRVIAVANQKGGVGKTVTSLSVATAMARRGRRTLLIDLDPQGHCGVGLGVDTEPLARTTYELLVDKDATVKELAIPVPWPELASLSFVPANLRLALAERELSTRSTLGNLALATRLKDARADYDTIVLDCPPSLSKLTLNAFLASDMVIIPVAVGFFSIHGVRMLAETLRDIFEETGLDYEIRCLITRYRAGQTVSREVRRAADEMFGDYCFRSVIRETAEVEKSVGAQTPLCLYAPKCNAAVDYEALCDELLELERGIAVEVLLPPDGASGEGDGSDEADEEEGDGREGQKAV